jgi:membrane protease YdiL (CAAX protease family)
MNASPQVRVVTYVVLVFAFSSVFYTLCLRHGMKAGYIFGLMWCPAMAGMITSLLTRRSLREFGWRPGKPRYLFAGWWIPMAYSVPAYLVVWATGLGGFPNLKALGRMRSMMHLSSSPDWAVLIIAYVVNAVLGVLVGCLFAAGEEIGWRGFLVPELAKFNSFTKISLISGIIWSLWHVPLIVWGQYNSGGPGWYSVSCFAVLVISISFVLAWIRLKSASLWPAVIFHASHNSVIQSYLDPLTVERTWTKYLIGEFGCALLPLAIICAWLAWRRRAEVERGAAYQAAT